MFFASNLISIHTLWSKHETANHCSRDDCVRLHLASVHAVQRQYRNLDRNLSHQVLEYRSGVLRSLRFSRQVENIYFMGRDLITNYDWIY